MTSRHHSHHSSRVIAGLGEQARYIHAVYEADQAGSWKCSVGRLKAHQATVGGGVTYGASCV